MEQPDLKVAVEQTDFLIAQENLREAKLNADISAASLLQLQTSMRPSRNYPVTLKHDGMQWVCRMVCGDDPRSDLIGKGDAPEGALVDFDLNWYGIQKQE
jgi:hypothetical protein